MIRQCHLPTLSNTPYFCLPESVGWYWDHPEHDVDRAEGALNNFSIHLIVGGKGYVEIDGEPFTLHKGDAFLYFPLMSQRYYSSQDDPWDCRWVHFYGSDKLKEFMIERGFLRSSLWTVKQWKDFEAAHQSLLEEAEQHSFLRLSRLSTLTYAIVTEFIIQAIPLTTSKSTEVTGRLLELLPQLKDNAHLPFELEAWARKAGVSPYYFCRLFRKTTQLAPLEFVTLCRLQRAKQLLLEQPAWTIKRIAEESGYANASYFNKRFQEQEGMTPSEYRGLHLGIAGGV